MTASAQISSARFSIESPCTSSDAWNRYVESHPKGSIFHTSGMKAALDATPKHTPYFIAARNKELPDSPIVALLASCQVDTLSGTFSRIASRSVWFAEPICDPTEEGRDGLSELIRQHDEKLGRKVLFTEIRPIQDRGIESETLLDASFESYDYLNYVVDLSVDEQTLWNNLSKSARKQIKKCQNKGVHLSRVAGPEAVQQMYQCVQSSYLRSGIPLADIKLFLASLEEFDEQCIDIRLAKYEGRIVAGGITLKFGDRVFAWYGGAERVTGLSPFSLLTWDEIKCGNREGFRYYDFGGAGVPERPYGPREFKAKFGGELVNFGRYRKINSKFCFYAAETAFKILKQNRLFGQKSS